MNINCFGFASAGGGGFALPALSGNASVDLFVVYTLTITSAGTEFWVDWGDGNEELVSTKTPTHTYTITGNYTIQVVASDGTDCSAKVTKPLTVNGYDLGNQLSLDGVNDFVLGTNVFALNPTTTEYGFAWIIEPKAIGTTIQGLFTTNQGASNNFNYFIGTDGKVYGRNTAGGSSILLSNTAISQDVRTSLLITHDYNGAVYEEKVYINGVLDKTTAVVFVSTAATAAIPKIGVSNVSGLLYTNSYIVEMCIWKSYAPDLADAVTLYNGGLFNAMDGINSGNNRYIHTKITEAIGTVSGTMAQVAGASYGGTFTYTNIALPNGVIAT